MTAITELQQAAARAREIAGTATQWTKGQDCRVITSDGEQPATINSVPPWPQREVQVYIPGLCLLAIFTSDGENWHREPCRLLPAAQLVPAGGDR